MRPVSKKRAQLIRRVTKIRQQIIEERGPRCQLCGRIRRLACHEIARGSDRSKALASRFAILVVCSECNTGPLDDNQLWPRERQLALLRLQCPHDYSLDLFNSLTAPRRYYQDDVDSFLPQLQGVRDGNFSNHGPAGR
jgi:hypothetical protein